MGWLLAKAFFPHPSLPVFQFALVAIYEGSLSIYLRGGEMNIINLSESSAVAGDGSS